MRSQTNRCDIIEGVGRDRFANINKSQQPVQKRRVVGIMCILIMGVMFLSPSCSKVEEPAESPTQVPTEVETSSEATPMMADPASVTEEDQGEGDTSSIGPLEDVAREDTFVIGWAMVSPLGVTNPWATGYDHHDANVLMWEGLAYWLIFADQIQPWLAESMDYTDDFTELTIRIRPEARWSDGTPVTSRDVVYTLEGHLNNEQLDHHATFAQFVSGIEAIDDRTTVITFHQPAPRFAFEMLTLKFDTGVPILPAHVLEPLDDPTGYAGGLEMPHSGPYTTVFWDDTRKILDLREDWWAVEAGLIDTPDVKRVVDVNTGTVRGGVEFIAHSIISNEYDTSINLIPEIVVDILAQNPEVTTHTGVQPPFGYLDWWPNSLWVNTLLPPYDDARVRRAISLAIDRDTINQIVYQGAQVTTIYPFPLYPGLQRFVDRPDVQALIEQYQPGKFDPEESATLMEDAGFALNQDGYWEKDGVTVNCTLHGFQGIHSDILPVLVDMLVQAGFDASVNFGADVYDQMTEGGPGLYIFGHGASIVDPYATLELYHSRNSDPIGTTTDISHLSRYNNPAYDAILDEMAPLSSDDPRFLELAAQALEIYWRDQIDIPIIQWLHRIPYNQTYWSNWPTADNLGPGVNGAFWHHTGMLVVTSLQKAK